MNKMPGLPALDALCGRGNWAVIGVSALVYDSDCVYLEIAKQKYWKTSPDGSPIVTMACIGGHPKAGETAIDCLEREGFEEIGVSLWINDAQYTRILFNNVLQADRYTDGNAPLPWFLSASPDKRPGMHKYAVIITYLAELKEKPSVNDIYGLLEIPRGKLLNVLSSRPALLGDIIKQGASFNTNKKLPEKALVEPILTAKSILQIPLDEIERRGL
jgi:hypothetical protein